MEKKLHACKKINQLPSFEALHAEFSYSPKGFLYRKKSFLAGGVIEPASFLDTNKRKVLILRGARFYEHRAVWKMHTGNDPLGEIDHINRIPTDNRIENLRDVDSAVNVFNKKAFGSIKKCRVTGHHIAFYNLGGERVHAGCFKTFDEARAALNAIRDKSLPNPRHEIRAEPKPMEYWLAWLPPLMRPF